MIAKRGRSAGRPRFVRTRDLWAQPSTWRKLHATLTIAWALLLVPSVLWWSESIAWVVIMSVWANIAGHFSAWQGSRAEDNNNS